jgi:uncharacterized protein YndB with AHSA1/START domain
MQQVPSDPANVVLFGDFEAIDVNSLYSYLTEPEWIPQWWAPIAKGDPRVGGEFIYSWPDDKWTLRGEFLEMNPGKSVSFTWHWDHEPVEHACQVIQMWMEPLGDAGSFLGIYHGKFSNTEEDQAARQGVAEGWIHFMMRLAGLSEGLAT